MPLLADYAITPDVFDPASYSTPGECEARLDYIRETILTAGLVRDLRDGHWHALFNSYQRRLQRHATTGAPTTWPDSGTRTWHRRGTELVKKLRDQKRLVRYPAALPDPPADNGEWCAEALATHAGEPLTGGVIVTKQVKDNYPAERIVARIDRLSSAPWWKGMQSSSVRLARTHTDYEMHLDPVLRCSNSLMFIDPHLDPTRTGYAGFGALLQRAGGRTPAPLVEIHRCVPLDQDLRRFERQSRGALVDSLRTARLQARVFIWRTWTRFHDRYLISNLVGISLPDGFDTGEGRTTWTRLGRDDRDDIQREFDPASRRHRMVSSFRIP